MKRRLSATVLMLFASNAIAQAADRGPQPPQPRPGWINSMTSVAGAERFNERATIFNTLVENLYASGNGDLNGLYDALNQSCKGIMGDEMKGGVWDVSGILHGGICGQYKNDLGSFVSSGKTRNLAKCSGLHGAIRKLEKIKSMPVWWYVGEQGERLQRNLLRVANTDLGVSMELIAVNDDGTPIDAGGRNTVVKYKFRCPYKA